MSDYENDYDYDSSYGDDFAEEFGFRERTSTGIMGDVGGYSYDPKDKFVRKISAQLSYLADNKYIGQTDKEAILKGVSSLKNISMRNSTAFIFGYIASDGGQSLTQQSWKESFKIFSKLVKNQSGDSSFWDPNVTQVDIIRYARYWMQNK